MGCRAMAALAWCLSAAALLPAPAAASAAAPSGPAGSYLVRVRADATPAFDFAALSAAIAADTKAASGTAVLAGVAAEDPPAFFHLAVRFVGTTPAQGEAAAAAFVRDAELPSSALSLRLGVVPDYAAAGAPRVRRCLHGTVDGLACRPNATGTIAGGGGGGGGGDGCTVVSTAGGVFLVILCGATLVVLASTGLFFLTGHARCASRGSPLRARAAAAGVGGGEKEGDAGAAVRRAGSASTEASTAATEAAEQVPVTRSLLPQLSSGATPAPAAAAASSAGDSGKKKSHAKQRSSARRRASGGPGSTPAPPLPSQAQAQAQAPPLGTSKSVLPRPPKQEEVVVEKEEAGEARGASARPSLPSFMRGSAPDSSAAAPDQSGASASAVEYGCGAKTPGPPPPPPPPQAQPLKSAPKGAAAPLPPPPPPTTAKERAAADGGSEGWPHLVGVLKNGRDVSYVPEAEGGNDTSPHSGGRSALACDDVSAVGYPAQPLQPTAAAAEQQHQPHQPTSARHPPSGKENESVGKQSRSHTRRAPLQPAAAAAANGGGGGGGGAPRSYDEPRHHHRYQEDRPGDRHRGARHHDHDHYPARGEPCTPPTEDDDAISFPSGDDALNHSYVLDRAAGDGGRSTRGAAAAPSAGYDRYEMPQSTAAAANERFAPDSEYSRYDSSPADDRRRQQQHHHHHDHRSSRNRHSGNNDDYLSRRGGGGGASARYTEPPQDFARSPPVGAYDRHERASPSGHYQEERRGGGGGGGAFSSPSVSPTEEEEAEYQRQRRQQRHAGSRQQRERVVYGDESPSSAGYGPVREGYEYEDDRYYGGGGGGGRHVPDDVRIQLDSSRLQHVSYDDAGLPTAYTKRYDM